VHPIERLRYVARAGAVDPTDLAAEAARALAAFEDDPVGLVSAARRLVARHPTAGPLWWTCNRVLVAAEPMAEARRAAAELADDPTPDALAAALPDGARVLVVGWPATVLPALARRGDVEVLAVDDGTGTDVGRVLARVDVDVLDVPTEGLGAAAAVADVVLIEAEAAGPDGALCAPGSLAAAAVARAASRSTWLVAGRGRVLPGPTFAAVLEAGGDPDEPWEAGTDLVPTSLLERVVGPDGPAPPDEALARPGCPLAPELLKPARTPGSHTP
jgi:hypothetical protein